jgi:hypothetical protein
MPIASTLRDDRRRLGVGTESNNVFVLISYQRNTVASIGKFQPILTFFWLSLFSLSVESTRKGRKKIQNKRRMATISSTM